MSGSGSSVSLSGPGTITITSGTLLNRLGTLTVSAPLAFGAAEANLFANDRIIAEGAISGTNGLTKSGRWPLELRAANTFTGPLTINEGDLYFSTPENLGTDTSPIIVNASGAGLVFTGDTPVTLTRGVETRMGIAEITATGPGRLTVAGTIAGAGGIKLVGKLALGGANTYLGPTVFEGDVSISGDGSFGAPGGEVAMSGTLRLAADWTTNRRFSISGSIDTGGHNATLAGVSTGSVLTKLGAGTLAITAASPFSNYLSVREGSFELSADGSIGSTLIGVEPGATLVLDSSGAAKSDRLHDGSSVYLLGGRLALRGHATAPVAEKIGTVSIDSTGGNVITLTTPGSARATLELGEFARTAGDLLVRSDSLGQQTRLSWTQGTLPVAGILPGIYTAGSGGGVARDLAVYDAAFSDGAVVGVRPLRDGDMDHTSVIQNPANGGTTSVNAHVSSTSNTTAVGAANTIGSLVLDGAGALALNPGQRLVLTAGGVLVRESASAATISGGTIEFATDAGGLYLGTETTLTSTLTGAAGFRKTGPGTLNFDGTAALSGPFTIGQGTVRPRSGSPLASTSVQMQSDARLDLSGSSAMIGALNGSGSITLGSSSLTIGLLPSQSFFRGTITGSGGIVIVDGGNPNAERRLSGTSSFAGGVTLQSGRLHPTNPSSLGTGPLTINGGSLYVVSAGDIGVPIVLNTDLFIDGPAPLPASLPGGMTSVSI